jgi:hypothetical protein
LIWMLGMAIIRSSQDKGEQEFPTEHTIIKVALNCLHTAICKVGTKVVCLKVSGTAPSTFCSVCFFA